MDPTGTTSNAAVDLHSSTSSNNPPQVPSDDEELQKAKLFTVASDDGAWTEIGIGSVHIRVGGDGSTEEVEVANDDCAGGSSSARMDVISLEEDNEILMSTPLVEDDIYVVQHGSILVWSDPEIGRDMALSFNTAEGCKHITDAIMAFQAARRECARQAVVSAGANLDKTPNVATRQTSSGVSSDGGTTADEQQSPWSVCRANLPTIALALHNNTKRLGMYIRDHDGFGAQLTRLFNECAAQQDLVGKDHIARIVVALLGPPFNTEGRILSQLIDNDVIDTTIAIVQHALGRRTVETGFVDAQARRATFSNPCHLPHAVVTKIHVLFAVQYLKDMLPLLLDEGDAAGSSLLGVFLLRFKFGLVGEILRSVSTLPGAFQSPNTHASLETMRTFVAFLQDLTKTIKNAMIPFDPKEELFEELLNRGTLEYVRRALWGLMTTFPIHDAGPPADHRVLQVVSMLCDIVAHMVMFLPRARDELLYDASTTGAVGAEGGDVTGTQDRQHANDDDREPTAAAQHGIVQGLRYPPPTPEGQPSPARSSGGDGGGASEDPQPNILSVRSNPSTSTASIWQGMLRPAPSLLRVMCHTAVYTSRANHPPAAQSAYDMLYSTAIGLLQGNVYASLGHNIQPQRLQVLRYWVTPPRGTLIPAASACGLSDASGGDRASLVVEKTLEVLDAGAACSEGDSGTAATEGDPLDAWPPLYIVLHAAGTTTLIPTADTTTTANAQVVDAERWAQHYRCVHHLYRQLIPLCKEGVVYQHPAFAGMLQASQCLTNAAALLNASAWSQGGDSKGADARNVAPHGGLGNVQATVLSWLSILVATGEAAVLDAVHASDIMDVVVRIYMARFGRRPGGGGCVIGSNAANVLHALRNALHNRKGISVGSPAAMPAAMNSNPFAFKGSSPFIRSLGKDDGLSGGTSGDASTTTGARAASAAVDTSIITRLLDLHGVALSASHVAAHRQLAAAFRKVVQETPEEALEEVSSSRATSTVVDRVVISDQDFNALLAEYGPDAPISETMLMSVVGDDVTGSHHLGSASAAEHHRSASCSSSDRDDDDVASSNAEAEEREEETARVGFLLRRETTLRRKRPLSPSPPGETPSLGDAGEGGDVVEDGSPTLSKGPRLETDQAPTTTHNSAPSAV